MELLTQVRLRLYRKQWAPETTGMTLIFTHIRKTPGKSQRRSAAVQFALFSMLVQAMIPFSAAVALPGADREARNGRDIPGFYLVICTAFGAQAQNGDAQDLPLDGGTSALMPWDCPVCNVQAGVQGPIPPTPQVALAPYPLPLGCAAPAESDRVTGLWTAAPSPARGPPSA